MKYWKYILFSLFNIGIINSYIVYKKNNVNIPKRYNLLTFKDALCEEMMKHYSSRVLPPKQPVPTTSEHTLVSSKIRMCRLCKTLGRKNKSGNIIRTSFACGLCKISFCKNCFHSN